MRIIIHIGTPKTGSTFLQHFFLQNRETLQENHILFPTTGLANINTTRGGRLPGHNELVTALIKNDAVYPQTFLRKIEKAAPKIVILSSENFSIHPDTVAPLAQLFNAHDVHIIIYLRRQDHYLESLYNEFINGGSRKITEDVEDFFYNHLGTYGIIERDYYKMLTPWAQAFGNKNILVRPFEKQQFHQQDLIQDFFHALNLPWDNNFTYPDDSAKNVSQDVQINKILLDLNRIPLKQPYYRKALDIIFTEQPEPSIQKEQKKFFSSPQLRHEIIKKYNQGNERVAQTYLAREDGRLFYDQEPDPKEHFTPVKTKDIDLASKLYTIFLMQLAREINDQFSDIDEAISLQKKAKDKHSSVLDKHSGVLDKHSSVLDKHSGVLDKHSGVLDKHSSVLDKHSGVLDKHSNKIKLLEKIIAQNQIEIKEEIKILKQKTDLADSLNRKNSMAIWLNARNTISRRIKNILRPEIPLIKKSGLFDSQWYCQQYSKAVKDGIDPIEHYVKKGVELGYNPSQDFNTCNYIQNNITVMMSGLNPLVSFIIKSNLRQNNKT